MNASWPFEANASLGNASWAGIARWADGEVACDVDALATPTDRLLRFVVHGVLLNAVGLGGLLGNALAGAVLSRPAMRSSTNCLLAALAACDSALILASLLLFGLSAFYPYTGRLRHYYRSVCPRLTPLAFPLALVAQTMSVYLTLLVTLERWVAVCHPLRARALCTPRRARGYVLLALVFAFAYNAPRFFEVQLVRLQAPDGDELYCVTAADFRQSKLYVTLYVHWAYLLVMYIVPFGALAVLNAFIVNRVWRAQTERARLSRTQRRELGLATMLLAVVLVFFLCNLLPLVTNASEVFMSDDDSDTAAGFENLDALVKISNLLVTINSSVNFVVYVIFGEKFKRVFLATFCAGRRWRRARDSPDHTRDDSYASCERMSLRTRESRLGRHGGSALAHPHVYYPAPRPTQVTELSEPVNNHTNGHARL